jgi:hypothetical protein
VAVGDGDTRDERAEEAVPMLENISATGVNLVYGVWGFFLNVAPHQFGLILVPLVVLGGISLWAARRPQPR